MLEAGDRVIAGVSGGADSVCLLFLLHAFQQSIPFSIRVVHVHHGIREDAGLDAAYVRGLCGVLEIPFYQVNAKVAEIARQQGISEEEAGREIRYRAFEDAARAWDAENTIQACAEGPGIATQAFAADAGDIKAAPHAEGARPVKVAVAHHMGDRAETFLFHLFRGSGLKGLSSIQPVREREGGLTVIRPLLCVQRAEIEDYLLHRGISFQQDSTNFEDSYARNRIRHHILPYAEEEICQGATRHVNETADLLSEAEDYLQAQTKGAVRECAKSLDGGGAGLQIAKVLELHPFLQKRLILSLLENLSPKRKDIGLVHVEAVRGLLFKKGNSSRDLPFGLTARKEYDTIVICRRPEASLLPSPVGISLDGLEEGEVFSYPFGGELFEFQVFPREKNAPILEKNYTKWFDYDKIKDTLFLRFRGEGDYFLIRDAKGNPVRKKLKEYFINQKVPREVRDTVPLLALGPHILWIVGYRISEAYKVDENTKTILQVTVNRRSDHEA